MFLSIPYILNNITQSHECEFLRYCLYLSGKTDIIHKMLPDHLKLIWCVLNLFTNQVHTKEIINRLEGERNKVILFLISKMMPPSIRGIENESTAKVYPNMWNSSVIYDIMFSSYFLLATGRLCRKKL